MDRAPVELVDFPPSGQQVHQFTLRDDNQHHYHRCMSLRGGPVFIKLDWRESASHPAKAVGIYRLDLRRLLDGGYIRLEREDRPSEVRVRIVHEPSGTFVLQVGRDMPRLELEPHRVDYGSVDFD